MLITFGVLCSVVISLRSFSASWLCALLALGVGACGKVAESEETEGESTGTDRAAFQEEALDELCRNTCVDHEPEPGPFEDSDLCPTATVSQCVEICIGTREDLDFECAACVVQTIDWSSAEGGGGEDFYCFDGYPQFTEISPSITTGPCASECESTRQRWLDERLAAPVPSPEGHLPSEVLRLGPLDLRGAALRPDGSILLALFEDSLREHEYLFNLKALSWSGELASSEVPFVSVSPWVEDFLPWGESYVLTTFAFGDGQLHVFDQELNESLSLSYFPEDPASHSQIVVGLGQPAMADAIAEDTLVRVEERELVQLTSHGDEVARSPLSSAQEYWDRGPVAIDTAGRLWQAFNEEGLGQLRIYEDWRDASGEGEPGAVFGSVEKESLVAELFSEVTGGVYAAGREEGTVIKEGQRRTVATVPFLSHLSGQKQLEWTYQETERSTSGWNLIQIIPIVENEVLVSTILVTREDPVGEEETPFCSVYGCRNITVRRLDDDGQLVWRYDHRATSEPVAAFLDRSGGLTVVGYEEREEREGLVLRFDLD